MKYLISLVILLTSCGPAWHLKRAEKHLKKAEMKGAKITNDTTYKKLSFNIDGPSTKINVSPFIIHKKDGVSVVLKDTTIYKDRIITKFKDNFIEVECPDSVVVKEIPTVIERKISAGYTKGLYLQAAFGTLLVGLIIGFGLGKIIKVGI